MAFEELKARQSVVWGNGPYQRITETITDIHELTIERLSPDRACAGSTSPAAPAPLRSEPRRTERDVTGTDLAPALIETAKERAETLGLEIEYFVGDCERLEFADGSFDAVSSTCGVMFAPDHEAAARELARVTRSGGRIALANWAPGGGVADLFRIMAPFQPAPPPSSPFDWGITSRVHELLGEIFDLELETHYPR